MAECNCGATTEGKWADIHSPTCPSIAVTKRIEELIRYNCRAIEGYPTKIDGIEDAAAAIYAEIALLKTALEPFTKLGGPNDGVMPAYHDLPDDIVIYSNSGECITAGDVRAARNAFGILHAPWKIPFNAT